jgi:hypothetical protein
MFGNVATDAGCCRHTKLRLGFTSNPARNRHHHRASHRSGHLGQFKNLVAATSRNPQYLTQRPL